jgi:CheY-like chemotaxis protein
MGNASLLLESLPPKHPDRSVLNQVVGAAHRAGDLTRQLLAYAGKGRFILEQVNVSDLVREISSLIQSSIPKSVRLRLDLAGDVASIEADASQIQQVIMNLVINGAEAIHESGTVIVTTGTQILDEQYIQNYLPGDDLKPGPYVALEVSDTGTGMDEETKARIFDPFFTTKFTGRGLGLAAVHGIVRGHSGALRVYSALGQGTTFKLFFPASNYGKQKAIQQERPAQVLVGSGTVLVIDDESIVRQTARNALERMGYQVELAENGEQGILVFTSARDSIAAILLDLTMPGLSGQETFNRLKLLNPNVPVILSSGFNEVEVARHFTGKRLAGFLQKPYTAMQLASKLETVLREATANGKAASSGAAT